MIKKITYILFLITLCIQGQESTVGDNQITFKSPSPNLISLTVQAHKGKIRFGQKDIFYINDTQEERDKKSSQEVRGQKALSELLRVQFQKEIIEIMDKEMLAFYNSNTYENEIKSFTAQKFMLQLANSLSSTAQLSKLFCNDKKEDCNRIYPKDQFRYRFSDWGGSKATEFQQQRSYTSFIDDNLKTIQKWSASIFPNNSVDGFFVVKWRLGAYDFKAQGYWLENFRNASDYLLNFNSLEPLNPNEQKLLQPGSRSQILFKIAPKEAEAFSEKHKHLFLVFDIKVKIKGINNYRTNHLNTKYNLNSSIINLYTDDVLTSKIGAIDINTMTTKAQ